MLHPLFSLKSLCGSVLCNANEYFWSHELRFDSSFSEDVRFFHCSPNRCSPIYSRVFIQLQPSFKSTRLELKKYFVRNSFALISIAIISAWTTVVKYPRFIYLSTLGFFPIFLLLLRFGAILALLVSLSGMVML